MPEESNRKTPPPLRVETVPEEQSWTTDDVEGASSWVVSEPQRYLNNRYELLDSIASGGIGDVFFARLHSPNGGKEVVAVKKLQPWLLGHPTFVEAFVARVRIASQLMHPNIVQIVEIGRFQQEIFVCMELVDGVDLGRFAERAFERGITLNSRRVAFVGLQIASALAYAHASTDPRKGISGVVHGGLTPWNVMVSPAGKIKLTNFGVAKAIEELEAGTLQPTRPQVNSYLSPEQAEGWEAGPESDVFALGCILYELLSGRRPFEGETAEATLDKVRQAEVSALPQSLQVPAWLSNIIDNALALDPDERYRDASDMSRAIRRHLSGDRARAAGAELGRTVHLLFPELAKSKEWPESPRPVLSSEPLGLASEGGFTQARRRRKSVPKPPKPRPSSVELKRATDAQNIVGRYVLQRQLGAGGIGITFLAATQGAAGFEKQVVIKKLQPRFGRDPALTRTLIAEAKTAVVLAHPNIVAIYDLGLDGDDYFIAMEYVPGRDLASLLSLDGGLPPDILIYAVIQVLEALEYAHAYTDTDGVVHEIIHRDVSPDNILVSREGAVKLTDFGIAKIRSKLSQTTPGTVKGKYGYMSPEQAAGRPLDHRTDLYQVGILLFEGLTGRRLFDGENELEAIKLASIGDVPSLSQVEPDINPLLVDIVDKALQKDADQRFQSAQAFHDALTAVIAPTSIKQLRQGTAEFFRELEQSGQVEPLSSQRTSRISITAPTIRTILVFSQDTVFTGSARDLLLEHQRLGDGFEIRFLESREDVTKAYEEYETLDVVPAGVVFGGLSVAMEEPLLGALRDHCTRKVLILEDLQAQSEVLGVTVNLCGLDAVFEVPFDIADLMSAIAREPSSCGLRTRVFELQRQLEDHRTSGVRLRSEMTALAQANVRAAELLAEIQEKDDLLARVAGVIFPPLHEFSMETVVLQGDLENLGVAQILEFLRIGRSSAIVWLEGVDITGSISVASGTVVDASLDGVDAEAALEALFSMTSGTFAVSVQCADDFVTQAYETPLPIINTVGQREQREIGTGGGEREPNR